MSKADKDDDRFDDFLVFNKAIQQAAIETDADLDFLARVLTFTLKTQTLINRPKLVELMGADRVFAEQERILEKSIAALQKALEDLRAGNIIEDPGVKEHIGGYQDARVKH